MASIAIGAEKLADPVAAQNYDQPVMEQPQRAQLFGRTAAGGQQMRKRFAPQGDRHPLDRGEDAEADLTRLVRQRNHQRRRWAMEGLPVLIWLLLLQVLQQRQPPPGGCWLVVWTGSAHAVERCGEQAWPGSKHARDCDRSIRPQSIDEMVDQILTLPEGTRYQLLAPVVRGKKGTHVKLLSGLVAEGFARVRINGEVRELADNIELDKNHAHNVEVVVDRLVSREGIQERLTDSLRTALKRGDGLALVEVVP